MVIKGNVFIVYVEKFCFIRRISKEVYKYLLSLVLRYLFLFFDFICFSMVCMYI